MEITVIRHGETLENLQGICQGQSEGVLSERGRSQALELRSKILDIKFDLVISSDLKRAVDTAEIIFSKYVPIVKDKRLRERGLYAMQGKELVSSIDYCGDIKGCESMTDMVARVKDLLFEIKNQYSNKRIALISHGVTIRVIQSICQGVKASETKLVENCSINKFIIP